VVKPKVNFTQGNRSKHALQQGQLPRWADVGDAEASQPRRDGCPSRTKVFKGREDGENLVDRNLREGILWKDIERAQCLGILEAIQFSEKATRK